MLRCIHRHPTGGRLDTPVTTSFSIFSWNAQKYGFRCSEISWLCSPSPLSSGLPLPLLRTSLPYPICILFLIFSLWCPRKTLSGIRGNLDFSSFFRSYFGALALISCKLGCTKLPQPQYQLLFSSWSSVLSREFLLAILRFSYFYISQAPCGFPLLLSTKLLILRKSSNWQWFLPTWILGFVVISCHPVLL